MVGTTGRRIYKVLKDVLLGGSVAAAIIGALLTWWLSRPPNTDTLRITYYRVSGLGLRLLTDGCLTPEWIKVFGQHPSIINNMVLKETQRFLEEYGTSIP